MIRSSIWSLIVCTLIIWSSLLYLKISFDWTHLVWIFFMTFFTQLRIFVEFKGGNNRASVITSGIAGFFNGLFSSIALNLTVSTWIGALYMIVLSLVLVIYVFYVSYYINKLQTVEEEGIH